MASLEAETRIEKLEYAIEELKQSSIKGNIDLSMQIYEMEKKLNKMKVNLYENLSPWEKTTISRMVERPTALDYIDRIFDEFIEFHGDRNFGDDSAIVAGIAKLNETPVTVIAQQKGRNTKENINRNFGMPNPEGYRKALRLMKQAEKFKRPVICFVDTKGAFCGIGAEERGQGEAIAKNLINMAELKTPIISIIIGEGGSGGALAMSVADEVWMLQHSIYSILSPEGFASILWKDPSRAREAAKVMKITAEDLKDFGIIDKIIKEPLGGAHKDIDKMSQRLKDNIIKSILKLKNKDISNLVQERYEKFRNMGINKVVE
ncbi:acetyl-CoA carboxylase carboxyltransferase subunit alpha [Clostridium algidicarnis]|uniref:acetyl-CoA carboxylase carboxyltransferase subunit alpha n=1 Tax=Clostridium algidicarnis TaxID=37659 RepID=UPI001C0CC137|nr:acetyl-CoA carboxylase carboxyltransferase subunit alpha [Clostridium algidicarnis]MBU3195251.1 acetyl-CoA carboxylase carboxyltransferase subunit alpha [Clostridium algidicarnis]MBU3208210.1 acetyl-CoA carboxylase carboxyltransferase subunit alpha [Clostridium algidicarnis]MBU3227558.1 acetyl-CoA carboxylase carboxyltransferase subunit alpha [Clostridium algidicarnis]MBU3251035.1 acetyl-CoA carboxylase carboxyltransferase subunit alpha [Clostridium algidicarnis]